ncbi:MAG: hypothetical protein HY289_14195 [Planctomycetes bacterium]|nr:hypothetical protein [Planctomycetota bacterium]
MRTMLVLTTCLILPLSLLAGGAAKVRELDTDKVKVDFEKGRVNKPTTITTAEELDKAIPEAGAIKKQVDFTKEKLVLFAWGGSGGDKLTARITEDGKTAIFTYKGGLTRDFRRHVHLFVLPKNADFKLEGFPGSK